MNLPSRQQLDPALIPSDPRFGCGPSLIPRQHLQALVTEGAPLLGTSHRKDPIINLVKDIQQQMTQYFQLPADYQIILGNGGASFLWDMIGLGLVKNRSLHFTCGEFSQKWLQAHQLIPWIETAEMNAPAGMGHKPHQSYDQADTLCLTLNETSTGVMLPCLPQRAHDEQLICIDATSGAGQMPINWAQADCYYFSPQKVFAAEGGLFFAILSPRAIRRIQDIARAQKDRLRYIPAMMDWNTHLESGQKHQTLNTPSITNLFLVQQQLKAMNQVGQQAIYQQSLEKARLIYQWAEQHPLLSPFVLDDELRSIAVATINVDDSKPVAPLLQWLRKEGLATDIDAYRKLGKNQLRIALFHQVTLENLFKLTKLIDLALRS